MIALPCLEILAVYRGGDQNPVPAIPDRQLNVVDIPNIGREGATYASPFL